MSCFSRVGFKNLGTLTILSKHILQRSVTCRSSKLFWSSFNAAQDLRCNNNFLSQRNLDFQNVTPLLTPCRWKSKKRSSKVEKDDMSDDEDEEPSQQEEDWTQGKDSKVLTLGIPSLRTDLVLKASLNMARNKVETLFYESKIRVNGKKLLKKSATVHIGDEIDVIRGPSPDNPSQFLLVSRIEVLSAAERNAERISVKVRRYPKLTIEDYEDSPALK